MNIYAVVDTRPSPHSARADAIETFMRRDDAERFIETVRGDDPELASSLRIEERERKTSIVSGPVSLRTRVLIGVALLVVVLALLAWWWSTVDLIEDIGLF